MHSKNLIRNLENKSRLIRKGILEIMKNGKKGHLGGSMSVADIVAALYYHHMKTDPYNPDWDELNPTEIIDNQISPPGSCAPILFLTGTHDYMIPREHTEIFVEKMKASNHDIIVGYYLLGSDGYDGAHHSQWGQSCIYYFERFLALTH